jgi:hypothetical protein
VLKPVLYQHEVHVVEVHLRQGAPGVGPESLRAVRQARHYHGVGVLVGGTAVLVGVLVGALVGVLVGTGVGVAVMVAVDVLVGTDVLVAVLVALGVLVGTGVRVAVLVAVAMLVAAVVGVLVGVGAPGGIVTSSTWIAASCWLSSFLICTLRMDLFEGLSTLNGTEMCSKPFASVLRTFAADKV